MKSKKEYIILGIIIAALAAYLVLHKTDRTHYKLPVLAPLTNTDITSIKLTKGPETIELTKKDDNWLIDPEKYPANKDKIDAMVNTIKQLTLTAMVSEAGPYERFELGPENKITVRAGSDGNVVRTFDIGKAAPSNRHTFVKLPDDDRVYHARDNFRNKFDQTKDELRDKTVLSVERSQVQQVKITDKDGNTVLQMAQVPETADAGAEEASEEKQADEKAATPENIAPKMVWQDADGNPVKESDVNNFFNNVSNLKCESYIVGKTKSDFTDPIYTITMTGAKTYTLSIFEKINKDDKDYPAISSENDYPFMLPGYKMDNMVKK